jgi:hypothetical protein
VGEGVILRSEHQRQAAAVNWQGPVREGPRLVLRCVASASTSEARRLLQGAPAPHEGWADRGRRHPGIPPAARAPSHGQEALSPRDEARRLARGYPDDVCRFAG